MCKNVDCVHSTLPVGAKAPTLCFDQLQGHHCGLELVEAAPRPCSYPAGLPSMIGSHEEEVPVK